MSKQAVLNYNTCGKERKIMLKDTVSVDILKELCEDYEGTMLEQNAK